MIKICGIHSAIVFTLVIIVSALFSYAQSTPSADLFENGLKADAAGDYTKAMQWYLKAAEQGDATAELKIGYLYNMGNGVIKDYQEALKWYLKSAEHGSAEANRFIGFFYEKGLGVTKDSRETMKWYLKAAEAGDIKAARLVGLYYNEGIGVTVNYAEAMKWYLKAAEKGDPIAVMSSLGCKFCNGVAGSSSQAAA